jgi:hypothetical protein
MKKSESRVIVDLLRFIHQVSIRRICILFNFNRSLYYYKETTDHQAVVLIQRIKRILLQLESDMVIEGFTSCFGAKVF